MKLVCSFALALFAGLVRADESPWEDPAVNAENRLPARTFTVPAGGDWTLSLNGTWRYWWCGSVDQQPTDFFRPDFDDSGWFDIDVPCCVETRGWGVPHYHDDQYPHKKDPPRIGREYNPVSSYIRRFELPAAWQGRRTLLRFDGVYACYWVWVNGRYVGYSEDSRLPAEFDVTSAVKPGANTVAVRVYRWCDGSYLEDQDMIRYSGIFRDVTLISIPQKGIRDFAFAATPDAAYRDWTCRLEVETYGDPGPVEASLLAADGTCAGSFASGTLVLKSPRKWSDEDPYLYTLVMRTADDERRVRVGVRSIEIKDGRLLVNGRAIKFKGVNRCESSAADGCCPSADEMIRDVRLFKRNNINCLRMSHYPNHRLMYDLCDAYGIYVCAEANVESHGIGYGLDCLPERPEWQPSIVERNVRNAQTYRNNASVFMWSVGNESGWGKGIALARDAVRRVDPTRPFHGLGWVKTPDRFGEDHSASDVVSSQYVSFKHLEELATLGKPVWISEYSCAMGNGMGNHREYWDAFYGNDVLSGGCIWDWIDQAVWIDTDRIGPDGKRIRYLGFGGDHDEQPNSGPYCANGLLDALCRPSAKLNEVRHVQQPVEVRTDDAAKGAAEFWNRYEFTFADDVLEGFWEVHEDGVAVDCGELAVPHVAPRNKGTIVLPAPRTKLDPAKEHFYRVSFRRKTACDWAEKGYEQAWNQLPFGKRPSLTAEPSADATAPCAVRETADAVEVRSAACEAVFSRRTGTLARLVVRGKKVLGDDAGVVHGPRLQVQRAFTDSDNWLRKTFVAEGLTQLRYHPGRLLVETGASVRVSASVRVTGARSGGFDHRTVWTFRADGSVRVDNSVTPFGRITALPRLGTLMRLDAALENMRYYGRGPWENAVDRCTGCDIAEWRSTVSDQYVDYIRPQDCGGKTDVRWVEFTDPKDGRGVRFSAVGEPMAVQALHFTHDDLDQARQRPGEPRRFNPPTPRKEVCLSLDCRQTGLGCNNCGPIPLEKYRFAVEPTTWTCVISPVEFRTDSLKPFPVQRPVPPCLRNASRAFLAAPSVTVAPGGRLWCTWVSGGVNEGANNSVVVVSSGDGGKSWTEPIFAIDEAGPLRAMDPGLWTDPSGKVWLFYAQIYDFWDGRAGLWAMHPVDAERAETDWTPARRLCDGYMKNKPLVTKSGRWLFPVEFMHAEPFHLTIGMHGKPDDRYPLTGPLAHPDPERSSGANVFFSDDAGATVRPLGRAFIPKSDRNYPEHMLVEREKGDLWLLVRTVYGIGESHSSDGGLTWPTASRSKISNPASRFYIGRLDSGALLLVKNGPVGERTDRDRMMAFVSDDDGATWKGGLLLDERKEVSYPDVAQGPDGFLHVVHDRERYNAREIIHHVFTEADVRAGRLVTKGSRIKDVVNTCATRAAKAVDATRPWLLPLD